MSDHWSGSAANPSTSRPVVVWCHCLLNPDGMRKRNHKTSTNQSITVLNPWWRHRLINRYYRLYGHRTMGECKEISIQHAEHHYYSDENYRCRCQIYRLFWANTALNDSSLDLFLSPLFSTCLTNTTKIQERLYIHAKLSECKGKKTKRIYNVLSGKDGQEKG